MAHAAMTSEMMSQLKLTAMGMMDKVVRRLEHGRVVSAWGSWVWYVDEGSRREGLLRRCMSQLVRAHEGRGWRRWVWCTEESRRRAELASLSGMSERERAALEGRLRSAGGSMFAKALHRIGHRLLGMGWRRWWSVVHGSRAADARAELGMAHDEMASEMTAAIITAASQSPCAPSGGFGLQSVDVQWWCHKSHGELPGTWPPHHLEALSHS